MIKYILTLGLAGAWCVLRNMQAFIGIIFEVFEYLLCRKVCIYIESANIQTCSPFSTVLIIPQVQGLQRVCPTVASVFTVAYLLPNFVKELKPRASLMSALVILQYSHPGFPCSGETGNKENSPSHNPTVT